MATPESPAETVRNALNSGSASASTVTTLQTLLSSVSKPVSQLEAVGPAALKAAATSRTTKISRPPKSTARAKTSNRDQDQDFQIHQDSSRTLPPKARYALATDIVNICLKVLSEATTQPPKGYRRESGAAQSSNTATPRRQSRTSSLSQRALQLRSGNTTPVRQTPVKQSALSRTTSQVSAGSVSPSTPHLTAVAECAHLGFSLLGSADVQQLGIRSPTKLQLETGLVSFVGMLIALRLDTMAVKGLRATKRRLESLPGAPERKRLTGAKNTEKETLASLLHLELDVEAHPQAIPVAIAHQVQVLRIILLARKPGTIEDALKYLTLDTCSSPANLMLRFSKSADLDAKATKQLEALAQGLLQLCPSVSLSADEVAQDPCRSPSPLVVFQLQILALRIRREAWKISKCSVDLQKEIAELFSKCMKTLVRRVPSRKQASTIYNVCTAAYDILGLSADDVGGKNSMTSRTFALLADGASLPDQSYAWAEVAVQDCRNLERSHARYIAAISLKVSLFLRAPLPSYGLDSILSDVHHITNSLRCRPPGSKSDYEQLVTELSRLACGTIDLVDYTELHEAWRKLLRSAAGFVSSYAKIFAGQSLHAPLAIVNTALMHSHSSEELLSWVSKDTAQLFRYAGALRNVAEAASSMPMVQAWGSSGMVLSFTRVLRAVVIKAMRTESENYASMLFDDEKLEPAESGALLEWQLNCALEMAHKPNYLKALQAIVPHMLQKLLICYPATLYPVRRGRIAALAMRVREQFPELVPPHILQPFLDVSTVDIHALGKDNGLHPYALDINASIGISLAFRKGPVAFSELASDLQIWQNLIDASERSGRLADVVDSPSILLSQLASLEEYAGVMGDNSGRLRVARMLLRVSELCDVRSGDRCSYNLKVASSCLSLGQAEKAGKFIDNSRLLVNEDDCSGIAVLEHHLCEAEHLLALDRVDKCQDILLKAQEARANLQPHKVRSHQSKSYKLLHGRGWLLQSRCFLASGSPLDSLRAAKRSAKVLNSIWSGIERATDQMSELDKSDMETGSEELSMEDLKHKVSKLNLQPKSRDSKTSAKSETRGAAFWPVARILCQALMHLSDVYAHHGVFTEANYSSEQAIRIAESIKSQALLSTVASHRCILLAAAGRIEDAELCLAQDEGDALLTAPSLTTVERLRAKCALSLKTGELHDALKYIEDATIIVDSLLSGEHTTGKQIPDTEEDPSSRVAPNMRALIKTTSRSTTATVPPKTRPVPRTASRAIDSSKTGRNTAQAANPRGPQNGRKSSCYMLEKLEAQLIVQGATISIKLGREEDIIKTRLDEALAKLPVSFTQCHFKHDLAMRKVVSALESDFAYNILPESTLSFPAVQGAGLLGECQSSTAVKPPTKSKRPTKGGKRTVSSAESLGCLLLAARQCLILDSSATRLLTTFDTHRQYSKLSSSAMLLSATSPGNDMRTVNTIREALAVDYPRMHAAKCQLAVADLEQETFQASDLLTWPSSKAWEHEIDIKMGQFQDLYVDILPSPWTVVSIGISQDCDELYITRYRREQAPFVLRLPFSRQKSEDSDEIFDFRTGRAELREIIELSNYSCHNSIDAGAKGAKNNWWSEREALDLRLQELLQNIENTWLGGFRGVFSQNAREANQLNRFRKEFETVLDRHLPSRQATKRGVTRLSLDDHVLELFTGLGSDQDGEIDLDELLSDLLYFVVDLLQLSGERNAYDEVDFDSMAIEVLDALRSYHDTGNAEDQDAHLILVLDRRLQAFPWESLPCLQNASVSRVDSMLCLRDRILEMRKLFGDESDRYTVTQQSGSYILNPSADLKNTEATLTPELSKLAQAAADGGWKGIVRRAPSEEEFSTALTTSSVLLYFGHGAGSQYIRPRAIRRLEKCSEVVWLMGCSSGAVTEYDELEPHAVPLAYLVAGQRSQTLPSTGALKSSKCMSVLATLWDVTDKDIDRFSLSVGEEWGLWGAPQDSSKTTAKTPRKREAVAAPLTPQRSAKTPKTPKVRKTPAPTRTPARSRSRARDVGKKQSMVQAVAKSRDACYLRYLNGAAPVVYGVPVYLEK